MKKLLPLILFVVCSQHYMRAQKRDTATSKMAVSVLCGYGVAYNNYNDNVLGYSYGVNARWHYGIHTVNACVSKCAVGNAYNNLYGAANNTGNASLTYGVGTYGNFFSAGLLAGIGYTYSVISNQPSLNLDNINNNVMNTYRQFNACLGLHTSVRYSCVGFGVQLYYNFGKMTTVTTLFGLEVNIYKGMFKCG